MELPTFYLNSRLRSTTLSRTNLNSNSPNLTVLWHCLFGVKHIQSGNCHPDLGNKRGISSRCSVAGSVWWRVTRTVILMLVIQQMYDIFLHWGLRRHNYIYTDQQRSYCDVWRGTVDKKSPLAKKSPLVTKNSHRRPKSHHWPKSHRWWPKIVTVDQKVTTGQKVTAGDQK